MLLIAFFYIWNFRYLFYFGFFLISKMYLQFKLNKANTLNSEFSLPLLNLPLCNVITSLYFTCNVAITTVQYSTVQYSTVQYSTVLYSGRVTVDWAQRWRLPTEAVSQISRTLNLKIRRVGHFTVNRDIDERPLHLPWQLDYLKPGAADTIVPLVHNLSILWPNPV